MFKWLKRHFWPHKGNDHRPHFLHRKNALQLVWAILFFELIFFVLPTWHFAEYARNFNLTSVLPGVLSTLTNEERSANNLPKLIVNPALERSAQLKAEDMASKGYFAHTSPEGITPWYWLSLVGYNYSYAGENLAVNFSDSEEVTHAWMNSPTHRANIVGGAYTEMGTGIATGVYKGREAVFVAQVYASPQVNPQLTTNDLQQNPNSEPVQAGPSEVASVPEQVLGESTLESSVAQAQSPNFLQRMFSNPRESANAVLYVSLTIVLLALLLNLAFQSSRHHADLLTNGAAVAVVVLGLYIGNGFIAQNSFETSFVDFTTQEEIVSRGN